jgi:hypothetical protein
VTCRVKVIIPTLHVVADRVIVDIVNSIQTLYFPADIGFANSIKFRPGKQPLAEEWSSNQSIELKEENSDISTSIDEGTEIVDITQSEDQDESSAFNNFSREERQQKSMPQQSAESTGVWTLIVDTQIQKVCITVTAPHTEPNIEKATLLVNIEHCKLNLRILPTFPMSPIFEIDSVKLHTISHSGEGIPTPRNQYIQIQGVKIIKSNPSARKFDISLSDVFLNGGLYQHMVFEIVQL